jgi:predicted small secreted protein
MRHIIVPLILLVALICSGCQTFKGLGKDMQEAGDWVQRTAQRAEK